MSRPGDQGDLGDLAEPSAWDAFVEGTEHGSYLQLAGWARVKAANGWAARRVVAGAPGSRIGMQLLLRRPRPLPWAFGYAPRGPVAESWTAEALAELTGAIRAARVELGRVSHLRIDPEVEAGGPDDRDGALRAGLAGAGWTPAPSVQPPSSRVIDLAADFRLFLLGQEFVVDAVLSIDTFLAAVAEAGR